MEGVWYTGKKKGCISMKENTKLWTKRILIYLCWIFVGLAFAFMLSYDEENGWGWVMGWFGCGAIMAFVLIYPPYLLIRDKWTQEEREERKEKTRTVMAYCTSFAFAISMHIALGKYNLIGMVEPLVFYGLAWYIPRRYLVKKRLREKAWEKIWEQEDADYPERKENNESRRRLPDRFAKFEIGAGELDSWIKMLSDSDKRERKKEERKKRLQIELCAINKSIKDIETSLYADSFRGEITEQELNILLDEVYRFEYKRRMESDDDDLDDDIDDDWDDELDDDIEDDVDDDD